MAGLFPMHIAPMSWKEKKGWIKEKKAAPVWKGVYTYN